MSDPAIEVNNLTKKFGSFTTVDQISFSVKSGEIFGFLGANGAGKSTTIRMLCGLLEPTDGAAKVGGYDVRTQSNLVTEEQLSKGILLPDMKDIRFVSRQVAKAVAIETRESGLGRLLNDDELERIIKIAQWEPHYYSFRPGKGNLD
ncbi:MAG: ATP-binding cassette domain-containing protein [Bacteroidetes bacterium]|nr:ATP-binding cassette domain-containing protein [Bacteroidota bacterium]MBU1422035.1 ATP-binding cassette domain-containing protein [Bacteroidota bacterium]MBU2472266.1 ATP-binding cassette domain-containing protein [Bacteroidota bacterium]MBU2636180.1 ATP-binding cassette domain-containing protein [Bacteroidota bacterium]